MTEYTIIDVIKAVCGKRNPAASPYAPAIAKAYKLVESIYMSEPDYHRDTVHKKAKDTNPEVNYLQHRLYVAHLIATNMHPELLEYIANAPYELDESCDFYVYKSVIDKAAKTISLFSQERPFKYLNIKTGLIAAITLVELNGVKLEYEPAELLKLTEHITKCAVSLCEIRTWILCHVEKRAAYKIPIQFSYHP